MKLQTHIMKSSTLVILALTLIVAACAPNKIADKGHRAYDRLHYATAVKHYEKAMDKGYADAKVWSQLADAYRRTGDLAKAERAYAQVVKRKHDAIDDLRYAQVLMSEGKYEKAVAFLENFKASHEDDERADNLLEASKRYLEYARHRGLYEVRRTNINTKQADFGPTFNGDQLVFSSARRRSQMIFNWNNTNYLDLYTARYSGKPTLGEPQRLGRKVNSKYHESNTAYMPDGETMYFTRNNYHKGKVGFSGEKIIKLKIYEAQKRGNKWKKVNDFPYNHREYSVGHPTITEDGKRMYFASDMSGGQGGVDIWYTERNGDTWGKPVNAGETINTEGNEMFPWIGKDGTLYFASNGHPGIGGLDIFRAGQAGGEFETPENMGVPINSPRDDFQLIYDGKRNIGFFTSNREGGEGDDDIYSFTRNHMFKGLVIDAKTKKPIPGAEVKMEDTRGGKYENLSGKDGRFENGVALNRNYMIFAKKDGYVPLKQPYATTNLRPSDETPIVIELEQNEDCKDIDIQLDGTVLEGGNIAPGATIKVLTREVIIEADENGKFALPLQPDLEYTVTVEEPGIANPKVYDVSTRGIEESKTIPLDVEFEVRDSTKPFFIIYYNYDKYNIRGYDARPELDRVVRYMQRKPGIKVELSSHTDCRASDAYNETLSKNRATEAYEYIVGQGIDKNRLSFKWFGEKQLTNGCRDGVKCSEEDHQLNRRTEFRLMR